MGGKPASARRRKAITPKRRKAATGSRQRSSRAVGEEADVALLRRERDEAVEQQRVTSEVLRAISKTSTDALSILGTIAESVAGLLGVTDAEIVMRIEGDLLKSVAKYGPSPNWPAGTTRPLSRDWVTGRAVIDRIAVHVPDLLVPQSEFPQGAAFARQFGHRTTLAVPLLREGSAIGAILIRRMEVKPFTDKQIELVSSFASQAVIAIENARLFNEVQERTGELSISLQQQIATSNVLKVISRSAFDLDSVLNTLVGSAVTLSGADWGTIFQRRGELYHLTAQHGFSPEMLEYGRANPLAPSIHSNVGRTAMTGAVVQIPDVLADPDFTSHGYQRLGNFRAMLGIPLKRDGKVEGVFSLSKRDPGLFEPRHVELVQTFADQAVIAIENARLFAEVQIKTRDLEESLQQQTATADVLKVISRSAFNLQTVLDTLVESAARLCDADHGIIVRPVDHEHRVAASWGLPPDTRAYLESRQFVPGENSVAGQALIEARVIHVEDVFGSPNYVLAGDAHPARTRLAVPLLRERKPIGVFALTRQQVQPFTEKQIELVQTFADQAVIAIENVRLFDEVQSRTRELAKSLDDLRAAQDRLVQTEKLASLGQLTAGIAHEIKNPLNFVNNFSTLSAELTDELNDVLRRERLTNKGRQDVDELTGLLKDNLGKVVQHGKRADSIVKNMLLHSRESSGVRRSADLNALVGESLNLAYHGARAEKADFNVALTHDFDPAVGAVELYPQEMTRALLNLISNGFYAATRRKAELGDETFEPVLAATTRGLGETVEIRIRDNGTGISPEVRAKMFNPFFTTKPTGEGTGLGLSMTHDIIVKQHGGRIHVETEPGAFTEFIITLPRGNGTPISEK